MENQNEKSTYNYGLALLRMLMCFEVVLCHFWNNAESPLFLKPFSVLKGLAVPIFMFLSFFLTERIFLITDSKKIKRRLWRLFFPQLGWAVIYWCIYGFLKISFNKFSTLSIDDLFLQILFGHAINGTMWFQYVLFILTAIFFLLFRIAGARIGILMLKTLFLLSLASQYSGLNNFLFRDLPDSLRAPLGRFCEMIPYAVLGFFCSYYKIFEKGKENRRYYIPLFFLFILFLFRYSIIESAAGFGYSNNNYIPLAFFVSGFAYLLPFEMFSEKILKAIQTITKYTLGIYCMHRLIAKFLAPLLTKFDIEINDFIFCVIIYVIGYTISFVMCKIPCKWLNQLVN